MVLSRPEPILPIDAAVVKAVEGLRAYAKIHPEARDVTLALDGILDRLIQDALSDTSVSAQSRPTIRLLEQVAALFPDSPIPLLRMSKTCMNRGEYEEALGYTQAGLTLKPDYPDLLFNRALCLLEMGKHEAAIEGFKHYVKLNPDNPWAYNNLGDAYRTLGLYDLSENYLKLAIQHDNRFNPAYYNLAMLYMDQQDWHSCVHYAQIAEKHDPFNKEVQLALGDAYMGLKEPESALQHLVTATLVDREFVEAYETMASAYVALGMYELSLAAAEEALKLNPDSWRALANIGETYGKQGRYPDAVNFLRDALQRDPDQEGKYRLCWELGWNYLQMDEYAEALEYTDRAIQMKEYPDVALMFNKGLILLAQGDMQEANAVYDQAMGRPGVLDNYEAILEAMRDIREFIAKKGIQVDRASSLFKLLEGNRDLPA